jgi:hypothetical protein
MASVVIRVDKPLCLALFSQCRALGRFTLRDKGVLWRSNKSALFQYIFFKKSLDVFCLLLSIPFFSINRKDSCRWNYHLVRHEMMQNTELSQSHSKSQILLSACAANFDPFALIGWNYR